MPGVVREKISLSMRKSLCHHIVHQREKQKQEAAAAEKDFERKIKEEEEERKRLEEENTTLEEIKEQLVKMEARQEILKKEKHQLFVYLKMVLNEERHKARLRELSEQESPASVEFQQTGAALHTQYVSHPQNLQYQIYPQQATYMHPSNSPNPGQPFQQGIKRPHSPTPPTSHVISMYHRPSAPMYGSQHKYDCGFSGTHTRAHLQTGQNSTTGRAGDRRRPRITMMAPRSNQSYLNQSTSSNHIMDTNQKRTW